ncbi:MAG: SUMF1/EgtB/PvdO family nonheme iron enzyme, partial [Myxococcales bacterium]|nr:SUMF1/EgtB/PvdO family nonheme iron enzyme [Myxococcales bacterium]
GSAPALRPIGSMASDVSVYELRDCAGGAQEYTASFAGEARVLRGGGWLLPFSECALPTRGVLTEQTPLTALGFRLALDGVDPMGEVAPAIVPESDWEIPEAPHMSSGPTYSVAGLLNEELTVDGRSILLAHFHLGRPAGEEQEAASDTLDTGPDRYMVMEEIARGSMGKVMLAYDKVLQRHVALKLLHDKHRADKLSRYRFVMEARITGRLQHPTMIPIYDVGVLRNGQRFFAMKVVEGQSLQDVLRARSAGDRRSLTDFGRDRLITVMRRVCQGVAFAHERRIVHRDLKPANILLGDYGEVYVVDLGLARQLEPDASDLVDVEEAAQLARADGRVTRVGSVIGTPYYMSPEQAMGLQDLVDASSDVYGLGAILYHVLANRPPFSGKKVAEVLAKVRRGNPRPPSQAAPDQDIPTELDDVVLRALAMDPRERQQSALDLAAELTSWQETARLKEQTREVATQRAARAAQAFGVYEKEQGRLEQLRGRLHALYGEEERHDAAERRRLSAQLQEKIRLQEERIEAQIALSVRQLRLALDARHPQVRDRLHALLKSRHTRAERARDAGGVAYYAHLINQIDDDGALARWLSRGSSVSIHSRPTDLQVSVQRIEERDRRLEAGTILQHGRTPLTVPDVPVGGGLAVFTRDRTSIGLPFVIVRDRAVELEFEWPEKVYPGFVVVPGGRFLYGGDPVVDDGQSARPARIPAFQISVHPVTCEAYREWLDTLSNQGDQRAARMPTLGREGPPLWGREGQALFGAYDPKRPVTGITLSDGHAYAQWRSRRDGVKYRLPTSAEWEKAARGVDGRQWPWGDHYDPVYDHGPTVGLQPVGSFAYDVSPYGVRDLVTGVMEWTLTAARDDPNACYVRGGCSALPLHGRPCTARMTRDPRDPSPFVGFRLVVG